MKKYIILTLCNFFIISTYAQSNQAEQEQKRIANLNAGMKMEEKEGWTRRAGIGIDLGQLININPYFGAGSNRLGFGGAINYKADYKRGLLSWKNDFLLNLTVQRFGSGTISATSDERVPFEKALDMININSNLAYLVNADSKWAYSLDLGLRTQLLGSYIDSASKKIYLKQLDVEPYNTSLVAEIFSPALFSIAPGMKYTPNKNLQFFFSPVAGQILIVANQDIANLGVHGTELKDGSTTEYKTSKFSLGALAKAKYTNVYFEKFHVDSELSLFSDYLDNPQNIDVVWMNSYAYEIFKGFNIGLRLDLFYDHNKLNYITDSDAVGGISGTGRRVNFIEQLLITYSRNF